jgi:hypothetical protein
MSRPEHEKIPLNTLAGCKWWDIETNTTAKLESKKFANLDFAMEVYEETLCEFENLMKKDSEQQWLRKVIKTGTHSDQVAALITLVQMSPVLGMPHIKQLLVLAQVKAVRIIQPALTAIKRLMIEELLPADRRLKFFTEQNFGSTVTRTDLLLAYYEDFLKKSYATFIQLMYDCQTSPIESVRNSCVEFSFDLLARVKGANVSGEQETPLLKLLVKGLGDKAERRVSAKAGLFLKKLATKRPHLKEAIIDEVKEQHLMFKASTKSASANSMDYDRGMSLACSLFSSFPLNKQDDAFVGSKLVGILSDLVNGIIEKKNFRDKKHKLVSNAGLNECEARVLRLCLKALESAFSAAGADCPIPETTNALLIRLCHETSIPGLSISILKFLKTVSAELKTDSPKLLRALYGQIGSIPAYLSNSLPYLLSLVKESVMDDAFSRVETKAGFKRRLIQVSSSVIEPVLPVVFALCEPRKMVNELRTNAGFDDDPDENTIPSNRYGYNPEFYDPIGANALAEPHLWESVLLRHHYDEAVRNAVDAMSVEVPKEAPTLSSMLIGVSTMMTEAEKKKAKKRKEDVETAPIEMPGI